MQQNHIESLDHVRIVLSHTSHPGNIGSAARAMKTMGLSRLYLVNPKRFPDAIAVAMSEGAADLLDSAQVLSSLEEALVGVTLVAGCTARTRGLSHDMLSVRDAAPQLALQAAHSPVALVFGTEMSGLTNAELDLCHLLVHIPANPDFSSLNLAAAVQILAYEMRLACGADRVPEASMPLAQHDEMEHYYHELERTLVEIGFMNPAAPRRLMTRLRRLYARARIEREELNILMGILKRIHQPKAGTCFVADPDNGSERS